MDDYEGYAAMYEAQIERNAECHYGDHSWQANGRCSNCDKFNGGILQWNAFEKAEREGRAHWGHYHRTIERKLACKRGPDPEWIEAYGDSEVTT